MNINNYFNRSAILLVFILALAGCANDVTVRSQSYSDFNTVIPSVNIEGEKTTEGGIFKSTDIYPESTVYPNINSNSYGNLRRTLSRNEIPSTARLAEWINYFNYSYAKPEGKTPVRITTEIAPAPWNGSSQLMLIGVTSSVNRSATIRANNIVVLVDISKGKDNANVVNLVKNTLKELGDSLQPTDKIAFVSYSSLPTVALESTHVDDPAKIKKGISQIDFGTENTPSGAIASINLAYKELENNLNKNGNNTLLFITDGDLATNRNGMNTIERTIARKNAAGITFSALVFNKEPYNYQQMQKLADLGGGIHAYVDTLNEASRALQQVSLGHETAVESAELNVKFNPNYVQSYRLLGYEKNNVKTITQDKAHAGIIKEGQTFTALYEIQPTQTGGFVQPAKYPEMARISLSYQIPSQTINYVLEHSIVPTQVKGSVARASKDFSFAAAVAALGLRLRNDPALRAYSIDEHIKLAREGVDRDELGLRAEFVRLLESFKLLTEPTEAQ